MDTDILIKDLIENQLFSELTKAFYDIMTVVPFRHISCRRKSIKQLCLIEGRKNI
jgi:hypothetical protein